MPVNHKLNEFKFLLLFFLILTFTCRSVISFLDASCHPCIPGSHLWSLPDRQSQPKIWYNTTFHFSEISKEHQESGLLISVQPCVMVWFGTSSLKKTSGTTTQSYCDISKNTQQSFLSCTFVVGEHFPLEFANETGYFGKFCLERQFVFTMRCCFHFSSLLETRWRWMVWAID